MRYKFVKLMTLLVCISLLFPINCKKSPTDPDAEVWELPVIWVDTFGLSFTVSEFAANPSTQVLSIKNIGSKTLAYSISDDADFYDYDWLNVSPSTGTSTTELNQHDITVNKEGLESREEPYTAKITIASNECYNSPQTIDVSLRVTEDPPPEISVLPSQLSFNADLGGANPATQEIEIRNSGGMVLNYEITTDVPWIVVSPSSGSSGGVVRSHIVLIDSQDLQEGTHRGRLTIRDENASNSPERVNVSVTVTDQPPPTIEVDPRNLRFIAQTGASNPPIQNIFVGNAGEGTLRYDITWDAEWLAVSPTSGTVQDAGRIHNVAVDSQGLNRGNYSGIIRVSDPNATNDPQRIQVNLEVRETEPPPPPSDANEIYLASNRSSGSNGQNVTFEVRIVGNTSLIDAFGLDLTFDPNMFFYLSTSSGNLTGSWGAVDGNVVSPGRVRIGGWGGANAIPIGSTGSIVKITLRVNCGSCTGGESSQICIGDFTDDIVSMQLVGACLNFVYN
jgi:hypothetical protein